jgi:hypothetical protein
MVASESGPGLAGSGTGNTGAWGGGWVDIDLLIDLKRFKSRRNKIPKDETFKR